MKAVAALLSVLILTNTVAISYASATDADYQEVIATEKARIAKAATIIAQKKAETIELQKAIQTVQKQLDSADSSVLKNAAIFVPAALGTVAGLGLLVASRAPGIEVGMSAMRFRSGMWGIAVTAVAGPTTIITGYRIILRSRAKEKFKKELSELNEKVNERLALIKKKEFSIVLSEKSLCLLEGSKSDVCETNFETAVKNLK